MIFYVTSHPRTKTYRDDIKYPNITLSYDNWDDFNFKTLYKAYFYESAESKGIDLGFVKILNKEIKIGKTELPGKKFNSLDEKYCSLGQSYDYYNELRKIPQGKKVLNALNDISINEKIREEFINLNGTKTSLLRFPGAERVLKYGKDIFEGLYQDINNMNFIFSTNLPGADSSHELPVKFSAESKLPVRMNIIIGRNGTGKTELLGRFTKSLVESSEKMGKFSSTPLINTVIAISYNAFDRFDIPDKFTSERINYYYCGLRSLDALLFSVPETFEEELNNNEIPDQILIYVENHFGKSKKINISPLDVNQWKMEGDNWSIILKKENNLISVYGEKLLPTHELYSTLRDSMKLANSLNKEKFLLKLFNSIFPDYDGNADSELADAFITTPRRRWNIFRNMSAGQRIVSTIICNVCAYIKENSILVIDEPENHLHPGLLSTLLALLNKILEEENSFAIIATHSPVVLQQVPSSSVRLLTRTKNVTTTNELDFECFGESLQTITEKALNLAEPEMDYHEILKKLARNKTTEDIGKLFDKPLGLGARLFIESIRAENSG